MSKRKSPELRASEGPKRDGKGRILPGHTGNPGGVSKTKRDFLERMRTEDAEEIYAAIMDGVRAREWAVVLKAGEWVLGKPSQPVEVGGKEGGTGLTVIIQKLSEDA